MKNIGNFLKISPDKFVFVSEIKFEMMMKNENISTKKNKGFNRRNSNG